MGVMVSEVYDAFVEAGVPKTKARAAAEAIPISDQLATKRDMGDLKSNLAELKGEIGEVRTEVTVIKAELKTEITMLEAKMWRAGTTIAGLAVLLNRFLDWVIPGK